VVHVHHGHGGGFREFVLGDDRLLPGALWLTDQRAVRNHRRPGAGAQGDRLVAGECRIAVEQLAVAQRVD